MFSCSCESLQVICIVQWYVTPWCALCLDMQQGRMSFVLGLSKTDPNSMTVRGPAACLPAACFLTMGRCTISGLGAGAVLAKARFITCTMHADAHALVAMSLLIVHYLILQR